MSSRHLARLHQTVGASELLDKVGAAGGHDPENSDDEDEEDSIEEDDEYYIDEDGELTVFSQ